MANASDLERAPWAQETDVSLLGLPFVAGVLKRLAWITATSAALAISAGPLFAPAFASGSDKASVIRIQLEREATTITEPTAIKCRSEKDGRQEELLELASMRLGGSPVEHVATRFWSEEAGEAQVTFEVWHGEAASTRKLYIGRGTVDMADCSADLISIT